MQLAIDLAKRGEGAVEPNPMVGCVIVQQQKVIGEGWHQNFGGPHAEVVALQSAGKAAHGATMYVTLEPCCHTGKTPPCSKAVIAAGISRIVIGCQDPFPKVDGGGILALNKAGIEVTLLEDFEPAQEILAPFGKLVTTKRPWVIAKWATSLDGKIAAADGSSQWISGEESRKVVHELRGRMDAILVGSGTALADDPLLTARPNGVRVATRIVIDSMATLPITSKLVQTANDTPVLLATSNQAPPQKCKALQNAGVEVLKLNGETPSERLAELLDELGSRQMTNLLIEGGGKLLGDAFDQKLVDELLVFIAPKIIGGTAAPSPLGGNGVDGISNAALLKNASIEQVGSDIFIRGRIA